MGSPKHTVGTWIRYLLQSLVGLYVVCCLAGALTVWSAARSAENAVEHQLPAAEREADEAREEIRSAMQSPPVDTASNVRDPRPLGAPAYSWRELRCEIRSIDSGWVALDFQQVCDLVDVDLYPTSMRPAQNSSGTTGTLGRCGYLSTENILPDSATWPENLRPAHWEAPASISVRVGTGRQLQADPPRTNCPTDVTAPPPFKETALLSGRRAELLPPDSGWVVVTRTDQVSRSRLGCNPLLIGLFCISPLPGPWVPDDL